MSETIVLIWDWWNKVRLFNELNSYHRPGNFMAHLCIYQLISKGVFIWHHQIDTKDQIYVYWLYKVLMFSICTRKRSVGNPYKANRCLYCRELWYSKYLRNTILMYLLSCTLLIEKIRKYFINKLNAYCFPLISLKR